MTDSALSIVHGRSVLLTDIVVAATIALRYVSALGAGKDAHRKISPLPADELR